MVTSEGTSLKNWTVDTRHYWIESLRIFLGLLIVYKGCYFVQNLELIYEHIEATTNLDAFVVAHYVVFAHLLGGVMIIAGLLTRLAVIFQIPIVLVGAWYFSGAGGTFFGPTTELEYSLLILMLLIVFLFYGAGKWSIDHRIMRKREEELG